MSRRQNFSPISRRETGCEWISRSAMECMSAPLERALDALVTNSLPRLPAAAVSWTSLIKADISRGRRNYFAVPWPPRDSPLFLTSNCRSKLSSRARSFVFLFFFFQQFVISDRRYGICRGNNSTREDSQRQRRVEIGGYRIRKQFC